MFNVILIGMPGAGKTTIGRLLAKNMSAHFVDTDELIVQKTGVSIVDIFSEYGESEFRKIERECFQDLKQMTNTVIATGGGMVTEPDLCSDLLLLGKTVGLFAKPKTLLERMTYQSKVRPMIEEVDETERLQKIFELFAERKNSYLKAEYHVNTENLKPEEVVQRIIRLITS